jgi:hypothetical protein
MCYLCISSNYREHNCISFTKPNLLMLCQDIPTVYCENNTEYINTVCGLDEEFLALKHVVKGVTEWC